MHLHHVHVWEKRGFGLGCGGSGGEPLLAGFELFEFFQGQWGGFDGRSVWKKEGKKGLEIRRRGKCMRSLSLPCLP